MLLERVRVGGCATRKVDKRQRRRHRQRAFRTLLNLIVPAGQLAERGARPEPEEGLHAGADELGHALVGTAGGHKIVELARLFAGLTRLCLAVHVRLVLVILHARVIWSNQKRTVSHVRGSVSTISFQVKRARIIPGTTISHTTDQPTPAEF